jgi:uncharacterized protein (TIGR03067 family)
VKFNLLAAVVVVLSVCAVSRSDDAKKGDGTWVPTSAELAGMAFPDEVLKTMKLVIKDGEYTATVGMQIDKGTFKITDASEKIKKMDITGTDGPNKGKTILAIFELDGDTMKVCYDLSGEKRPTEFKTKPDTKLFLAVYKRQ